MNQKTQKPFQVSLSYCLGFLISCSIILGLFLENPVFAVAVAPFLFGTLGFLWCRSGAKRLYVGILSALFWTIVYSFFATGILAWMSLSIYGFGDHPYAPESDAVRVENELFFLKCQGFATAGACLVAWIGGYVGGQASKLAK